MRSPSLASLALFATSAIAVPTASTNVKRETRTVTAPAPLASECTDAQTFTYLGVNESSAEFGNQNIPGELGTDYTWPSPNSIDYFVGQGFNFFRVPFQLERLAPPATGITGAFDETYLGKDAFVAIEPHNFLIYNGATLTSTEDFQTLWSNLAAVFVDNDHVIFDLMNEPHDVPATDVAAMMQAGINGVRASGATSQLVLVEGISCTGAWSMSSSSHLFIN
uniref:cellulase n=1 Tax=Moniliophthora roreri TaxID=221103 RepID=A0A0W0FPM0_MONRR